MNYVIAQLSPKNGRDALLPLWAKNLPSLTAFRYDRHYENNPFGRTLCLVVQEPKGSGIVGSVAMFPRSLALNGSRLAAGMPADFSMNKEHRMLGPALALQKNLIANAWESGIKVLYSIPNSNSLPVILATGYKILGTIVRMTKPLRSRYFLGRFIRSPRLLAVCSGAVNIVMNIVSRENYIFSASNNSYGVQEDFDPRFDTLWEHASRVYPVIAERSSTALRWRYTQSTPEQSRIFTMTSAAGDLLGYVIYTVDNSMARIMDFLARDADNTLDQLMRGFIRFQRKAGAQCITTHFLGNVKVARTLQKYGFVKRKESGKVVISVSPGCPHASTLMDAGNWYFLDGDSDI